MSERIYLLGVGPHGLDEAQQEVLSRCGCIVGAERHLALVDGVAHERLVITPVKDALAAIRSRLPQMDVAVLSSGDPLFYGIGRTLLKTFGRDCLEIMPALSSMQLAFARFKEPWDDAVFVSLHGRSIEHIPALLLPHAKVFVFTDRERTPGVIAANLLKALAAAGSEDLAAGYSVFVGENLGLPEERIRTGSLTEVAAQRFADLNVMILRRGAAAETAPCRLGLTEDEIDHSRGLITKDEVRAVVLHKLRLPAQGGVLWDIGAGSGSVSLEAARLCPQLTVYAVEQRDAEADNIRRNISRFRAVTISLVQGAAPEALSGLPAPDRVFIGGSGGRLAEIIRAAAARLAAGGRIVVNGVTAATCAAAPRLLYENGLQVAVSEISVKRQVYAAAENEPAVFNPIAVMVGEK